MPSLGFAAGLADGISQMAGIVAQKKQASDQLQLQLKLHQQELSLRLMDVNKDLMKYGKMVDLNQDGSPQLRNMSEEEMSQAAAMKNAQARLQADALRASVSPLRKATLRAPVTLNDAQAAQQDAIAGMNAVGQAAAPGFIGAPVMPKQTEVAFPAYDPDTLNAAVYAATPEEAMRLIDKASQVAKENFNAFQAQEKERTARSNKLSDKAADQAFEEKKQAKAQDFKSAEREKEQGFQVGMEQYRQENRLSLAKEAEALSQARPLTAKDKINFASRLYAIDTASDISSLGGVDPALFGKYLQAMQKFEGGDIADFLKVLKQIKGTGEPEAAPQKSTQELINEKLKKK